MNKTFLFLCFTAAVACFSHVSLGDDLVSTAEQLRVFDGNQRYRNWQTTLNFEEATNPQDLLKAVTVLSDLSKKRSQFCTSVGGDFCRSISGGDIGLYETYAFEPGPTLLIAQALNHKYRDWSNLVTGLKSHVDKFLTLKQEGKFTKEFFLKTMQVYFNNIESGLWYSDAAWIDALWNGDFSHPFRLVNFAEKAFENLISESKLLTNSLDRKVIEVKNTEGQTVKMPFYRISDAKREFLANRVLGLSMETINRNALPCAEGEECIKNLNKLKEQLALGYIKPDQGAEGKGPENCQQQANECQKDLGTYKDQLEGKNNELKSKEQRIKDLEANLPKGEHGASSKLQIQNTTTAGKGAVTSGAAHGVTGTVDIIVKEVAAFSPQNVESLLQSWNGYVVAQNQVGRDLKWNAIETLQSSFMFQGYKIFNPNTKELLQHDLRAAARLNLSDKITSTVVAIIDSTKKAAQNPIDLIQGTAKFFGPVVATAAGEWCVSCLLTNYFKVTQACANVAAHSAGVGVLALATGGISLVGLGVDAATYTLFGGWDDIKTCYTSVVYKKKTA